MKDEFIELYTAVYKDLYRYALYVLGNREDAEDAVSEAVVDAYAEFGKLRDKGAFKGWIFKILSAKCKRRLKGYVNKTLELDGRERQVIAMSLIAGYEGETIARLMKMNHNTVRTVKSRALEKLRRMLV